MEEKKVTKWSVDWNARFLVQNGPGTTVSSQKMDHGVRFYG